MRRSLLPQELPWGSVARENILRTTTTTANKQRHDTSLIRYSQHCVCFSLKRSGNFREFIKSCMQVTTNVGSHSNDQRDRMGREGGSPSSFGEAQHRFRMRRDGSPATGAGSSSTGPTQTRPAGGSRGLLALPGQVLGQAHVLHLHEVVQ